MPGPSDDRYADYYRRNQAAQAMAGTQPSPNYGQPAPSYGQPPLVYSQPSPTTVPSGNVFSVAGGNSQAYPPSQPQANSAMNVGRSPMTAAMPPAYAVQSSPPAASQPIPSASAPAMQSPAANPLGLDGFCCVSLLERHEWIPGDRRWGAIHRGRTYLFVGPDEQRRFLADPDRYAPVVSGNDVVLATEQGQAVSGMREHGVFFGNRVYLFSSEASLEKFAKNPSLYANQALEALRSGAYPNRQWR